MNAHPVAFVVACATLSVIGALVLIHSCWQIARTHINKEAHRG